MDNRRSGPPRKLGSQRHRPPILKKIFLPRKDESPPPKSESPSPISLLEAEPDLPVDGRPSKVILKSLVRRFDEAVCECLDKGCNLLEDVKARHLLKEIYSYCWRCPDELKPGPGDDSALKDLPRVFAKCVATFKVDSVVVGDEPARWWAYTVGILCMNWSDVDVAVRWAIVFDADGLLAWFRSVLVEPELPSIADDVTKVQFTLEYYLSVVHNLARFGEFRPILKEMNFTEVAETFLSSNHMTSRCVALLLTANLVSDSDIKRLSDNYGIIPTITEYLESALATRRHKNNLGFSAEELAEGANSLMVNDENKAKFVEAGMLPLLSQLIHSDDGKEQSVAIDCLWTLAFGEDERQEILEMSSVQERLKELAESQPALKNKASNALEFIKNGKANLANLKRPGSAARQQADDGHIFLSYSWKQQETVKRLCQFLKGKGLKTWMDIDEMKGSTLEAMAGAIENAKVVLLCYSEDYKQSPNCRTEAEYLFQLRKPFVPVNLQRRYRPDGWLGLIIGAKLYIDLSLVKTPFEEASAKILTEMANTLGLSQEKPKTPPPATSRQPLPAPDPGQSMALPLPVNMGHSDGTSGRMLPTIAFVKLKLAKWTVDDVRKWCADNSLGGCDMLQHFDGPGLASLYEMKVLSADAFFGSLSDVLGGSLANVMLLSEALEQLPVATEGTFRSWTKSDVRNWIEREKLTEWQTALADFDGRLLWQLCVTKATAPAFFYNTLSKNHNGPVQGLFMLLSSLDRLWLGA